MEKQEHGQFHEDSLMKKKYYVFSFLLNLSVLFFLLVELQEQFVEIRTFVTLTA